MDPFPGRSSCFVVERKARRRRRNGLHDGGFDEELDALGDGRLLVDRFDGAARLRLAMDDVAHDALVDHAERALAHLAQQLHVLALRLPVVRDVLCPRRADPMKKKQNHFQVSPHFTVLSLMDAHRLPLLGSRPPANHPKILDT